MMFDAMNINTSEVLEAASTKWNFFDFKPGLVGGHCIPVDPYYLTYIAEKKGYKSKIILLFQFQILLRLMILWS